VRFDKWFLFLSVMLLLDAGAAACISDHHQGDKNGAAFGDDDDDNDRGDDDDNDDNDSSPTDDDDDNDDDNDDNNTESVWTDPNTGYMWQNGATVGENYYEWDFAEIYCAGLTWDGYSDWRLPDIDQLRSLIRGCTDTETGGACGVTDGCLDASCWDDACEGCSGSGPGPDGAFWPSEISGNNNHWYWSSSAVANAGGDAWNVGFGSGNVNSAYGGVPSYNARCIRP